MKQTKRELPPAGGVAVKNTTNQRKEVSIGPIANSVGVRPKKQSGPTMIDGAVNCPNQAGSKGGKW